MSKYRASIDIGSNSVLLLIAELQDSGVVVKESLSEVTGLGRDLDKNNKFLNETMDNTYEVLKRYTSIASKMGITPENILATATEASRVSQNAQEFYNKVKSEIGLDVKIITGEAEATFSARGILFDKEIGQDQPVIMDIGGASTELIRVEKASGDLLNTFSMPMGAVRFTNWKELSQIKDRVQKIHIDFKDQLDSVKTPYLHCVAGTMTSIGNMYLDNKEFHESEVHGLELTYEDIKKLKNKTSNYSPDQYLELYPFLGKRCATISGGLDLALTVLEWLEVEKVRISTYGLRYGVLLTGAIDNGFIYR